MKKLLTLSLFLFSAVAFSADMRMPYRGVADGDTVRSSLKLPCPLCNVSVRIIGIDTPESNYLAKCPREKELGLKAKYFLMSMLDGQIEFMARNVKWDKYGGRILASIEVNGVDLGQALINEGLAKPYTGVGPKPDWCI